MITKINICKAATFCNEPQSLEGLKKFNFFYGANGTGKTTISRILDDQSRYPQCNVIWENNLALETRVYNRDFVDRNFNPQSRLKGVFTLGELEADTLANIEAINKRIEDLTSDITNLATTLQGDDGKSGKRGDLAQLEAAYKEQFWIQKQKNDKKLAGGLEGYRNDKEKFKTKVLSEFTNNKASLLPIVELEQKAEKIFSNRLSVVQNIDVPQTDRLLSHEQNPILKKRVIGKDDVDIAAIIKKLGNSDWVRQGLSYYEANDGVCPFCQQKTNESFAKSLSEYFDQAFETDSNAINKLVTDYSTDADRLIQKIQEFFDTPSDFLDTERLKDEKQILDSIITINNQRLEQKKKEASQIIELNSLRNVLSEITNLFTDANKKIKEHNSIVENITHEKKILTDQIWRFIVEELKPDIAEYNRRRADITRALDSLSSQVKAKKEEKLKRSQELRELEKHNTSIQPTCDGINALLASFGFKSFHLAIGSEDRTYRLIRPDGVDAQETLSEGEKNFITFLYFYYLLKGSQEESGVNLDKVVVFDDPISSLDNEVLFIVSSLIRELYNGVRENIGSIKQIIVLTHNIYFHKEVTFNSKRKHKALTEETFWLVRKFGNKSVVEKQVNNPVKTSYELLWEEVRNSNRNNAMIQNTLRRILENYFKLLGGISLDDLYMRFDGDNKLICKALCSWVHDGSHSAFDDDYYTSLDDTSIQKYLDVFRQIFERSGQISHYNMMMGTEVI